MTHKTKDCLSRPRKQGAKWTGRDIQADEVVDSVQLGWDAKRDRWNGYDASGYTQVVKDFEELESLKKAASGTPQNALENGDTPNDSDVRYGEETDLIRSQPTSTRQLRLREDTAKYLLDLNPDSAAYDPKTRSMDTTSQALSAPNANRNPDLPSDGFVRPTPEGNQAAFERAQRYAWETQESSTLTAEERVHLQANPTAGAVLMRKHEEEVAAKKASRSAYLMDKYGADAGGSGGGGDVEGKRKPVQSIAASEAYTEYDDQGKPKGALPAAVAKSKYPEDIHPNNHTSVFGSYWSNFTWGYACCHSSVRNSYCTGEEGRAAFEAEREMKRGGKLGLITDGREKNDELVHEDAERNEDDVGDEDSGRRKEANGDEPAKASERYKKRTLEEIKGITSDEMESYKRSKMSAQDPMASMLGKDELVS